MLQLLIVDDEPLAHQVLQHLCAAHADLQICGHCYSAAEAMAVLAQRPVDLLLLDIRMPVLTGLDMLKMLATPPQVIMTTAYREYALDGFALDVTDYLLKPISAERFAAALHKVRRRAAQANAGAEALTKPLTEALAEPVTEPVTDPVTELVLKVDRQWRRFQLADVCCFEAYGNYVKVWQGSQMTLVSSTLKQLQQKAGSAFVQVHKSFLVNARQVVALDSQQVQLANGQTVRIGEAFKAQARQLLKG